MKIRVKSDKPSVILHIGQYKTGTTSIQACLRRNRQNLIEQGVCYPATKYVVENHRYLAPLIMDRSKISQMTLNSMGMSYEACVRIAEHERSQVIEQCRKINPKTVIFSTESLFGEINAEERTRLQELMDEIGDNLRIIAYLRSPVFGYLSQCQQRLKTCREIYLPRLNQLLPTIESYAAHPKGQVECRVFERTCLARGDVVTDFAEWTGINLEVASDQAPANVTMSAEAMAVLSRMGLERVATNARDISFQRRLVNEVRRIDNILPGSTKPALLPEVCDFLTRTNTELLELRDSYHIVFPDVNYELVGKIRSLTCPNLSDIRQICRFDEARADELARRVRNQIREGYVKQAKSHLLLARKRLGF